ncbi:MAG: GC-type dockerin domain-anchored protein [Phycisphaerales bacterium JB060]
MRTRTTTRTTSASIMAALALATAAHGQGGYPDEPVSTDFLRGVYGFEIYARTTSTGLFGRSIGPAGDFNGDGIDDLAVGSLTGSNGFATILFGRAHAPFGDIIHVEDLDGTNGLVIRNIEGRVTGRSVAGVGDMNGDGGQDLFVSSGRSAGEPNFVGYVLFGRPPGGPGEPMPARIELSEIGPDQGVVLVLGEPYAARNPYCVGAPAGDVNADGVPDLLVSAANIGVDGVRQGRVFVVYGNADGLPARIDLHTLDGTDGFVILPEAVDDFLGVDVDGAGDVNGDGIDDIIVSAPGALGSSSLSIERPGAAYVVFGRAGGLPAEVLLADLDGSNGFAFKPDDPRSIQAMGTDIAGVGDLNGDGLDDVAIGESGADVDGLRAGVVHVIYGRTSGFPATLTPADLTEETGLLVHEEPSIKAAFGWSVNSAGDVNADGRPDMVIGAPGEASQRAVVVFGQPADRPLGVGGVLDASQAGGDGVFRLTGRAIMGQFGNDASGVGDINADGADDIGVGAWLRNRAVVHLGGGLCPADLVPDGVLDVFDFLEFLNLFDAGDPRANWDQEGGFTIFDFLAFQTAFDAGCP